MQTGPFEAPPLVAACRPRRPPGLATAGEGWRDLGCRELTRRPASRARASSRWAELSLRGFIAAAGARLAFACRAPGGCGGGGGRWRGRRSAVRKRSAGAAAPSAGDESARSLALWGPKPRGRDVVQGLVIPTVLAMVVSLVTYPPIAVFLHSQLDDVTVQVLKGDVSQFMQNFFNYNGLLFSFFASQTYAFLYQQQENLYISLYAEVSEARSLLEQLTLVSQSRPNYRAMLESMNQYVEELVLGVTLRLPPAVLVSAKPVTDPLENILYLTSVGMPSVVYDTVRALRQARGARLGATQRKLPTEHFALLYSLGVLELLVFPLLGAGIADYEPLNEAALPGHVLWVQAVIFALLTGVLVLTLQLLWDLRSPTTGLYSMNTVLQELVDGLRGELDRRINSAPPCDAPAEYCEIPPASLERSGLHSMSNRKDVWESLEPQSEASVQRIVTCGALGLLSGVGFFLLVQLLAPHFSESALQAIREDNNAQWLQNFFTGIGFVFSLFVAQTFAFLYSQQEQIYLALYAEVSEAKAVLEQLTLICGRRPFYSEMLLDLQRYVRDDLERFDVIPSEVMTMSSVKDSRGDPLENILYLTSVGVPSAVYETVRGLRQARGRRLGAVQKKLPRGHFILLNGLGLLELSVFPFLAVGCMALSPPGTAVLPGHILFFQSILFGLMSSAVCLTLQVLRDLWRPYGDVYNMSTVVREMVSGLEDELELRLQDVTDRQPEGTGVRDGVEVSLGSR